VAFSLVFPVFVLMRRALSGVHSSRSVRQRSADVHWEIRSPLTPQRVVGVRNQHLFIGAELLSPHRSRRYWIPIATSDDTALREPITPVPKISVKILHFLVFFCFARLFPWRNLILAATSLQSSDICFLPIIMAAVKCINEPQVYVVRSVIVVISIVYIWFVLQISLLQ